MPEERARHLGEGALDQVEPRAMLGCMNLLEAPGARAEKGHGLLGDMGRVLVEHEEVVVRRKGRSITAQCAANNLHLRRIRLIISA